MLSVFSAPLCPISAPREGNYSAIGFGSSVRSARTELRPEPESVVTTEPQRELLRFTHSRINEALGDSLRTVGCADAGYRCELCRFRKNPNNTSALTATPIPNPGVPSVVSSPSPLVVLVVFAVESDVLGAAVCSSFA